MSGPRRAAPAKLTGGGGFTFEDETGALLVSALAAGHPLLGGEQGQIARVGWQRPATDWPLDDVLVQLEDGRRCAASIKSYDVLSGGRAEADFAARAWECLLGENRFDAEQDLLGLFGAPSRPSVRRDLQTLLGQAAAGGPEDLAQRIASGAEPGARCALYASFACPEPLRAQLPVDADAAAALLLSRLVVLELDFEERPSERQTEAIALAGRALIDEQAGRAPALHDAIRTEVARRRPAAGALDWAALQTALGQDFAFAARPDARADLRLLDAHGERRMDGVSSHFGGVLELAEREALAALFAAAEQEPLIALVGPSGCGKSVLAKQWLRSQADGLWLDADELEAGLDGVRLALSLTRRPDAVLALCPWGTCVVLDGLDRSFRRPAFAAARELAAVVADRPDLRLVITAQSGEWRRVGTQLQDAGLAQPLTAVAVDDLSQAELARVLSSAPALRPLAAQPGVADLLRRPKLLDVFVRAHAAGASAAVLADSTDEAQLAALFWERLVEGHGPRRVPRAVGLMRLADEQARRLWSATPEDELEPALLSHVDDLVREGLLDRRDGWLRFAHDLYGDWARYRGRGRAGAKTSQRRGVNHARVGVLLELTGPVGHVLTHRARTVTAVPLPA